MTNEAQNSNDEGKDFVAVRFPHSSFVIRHFPHSGFTLIEVLAALLFLAIVVPVVVAALSLSSRVSTLAERRAVAVELAENQLNEELIGNSWQSATVTSGSFSADYPGYTWQMTQTAWSGTGASTTDLTQLEMDVTFPVQGRPQSVRLTTLVSPTVAGLQAQQLSGTNQTTTPGTTTPATTTPATKR